MELLTIARLDVPRRLAPAFDKVRRAIERDDFASADMKKLTGHPFFRAKLDKDSRLLVQFVEHRGKRACLALEVIEQHAYDRSRFLRGARVDEERSLEAGTPTEVSIAESLTPVRYLHPGRAEFHVLDKPLSFDDRQAELFRLPLPLVMVGCAGSGKTALTLTKLRELGGEVLYVTQSAYLAESAAGLYHAHGYENEAQNVEFSSYRALLESIEVPRGREVTLRDFRPFFKRHEASLRFTTAHQLFEELRGVIAADAAGVLTLEQYTALGVRQSIYPVQQRPAVYAFFAKYREWLAESGLYDSNLLAHSYRPRAERKYDAVVVDEVQDLTNAQLSLILACAKDDRAFLLCGDANQIVHPNFFSWSKVKSLFYSREEEALAAPIHVLDVNYRSSQAICRLANTLLEIKNARFGSIDRESTALVRPAAERAGRSLGLTKQDAVLRELNQRTRGSAQVAVIVLHEEQKAEARQRFSTPLIFSVHEAKGLEYDAVILYDIISSERAHFREITAGIEAKHLRAEELVFARPKDKNDKSLEIYKFFVNALYVALTRAVDTVYIVESDVGHPLLALLGVACADDLSGVSAKASSVDEWQREARRLELQGKQEQAEAIRKNVLRTVPVPWTVLDASGFRQAYERSFQAGSVYNKAKQQLFEFAAFHGLGSLAIALQALPGFRPQRTYQATAPFARERAMAHYQRGDRAKVMAEVDRHGIEHRNMMGMTPLMMAADTGQVALVEALIERGARIDAVDTLGRMPVHFALRRAFESQAFAEEKLGPLYELSCPTAVDIEVERRRVRLGRNQGEFFLLACMIARFHELYASGRRYSGFGTRDITEKAIASFPRSVLPEARRRREYWSGVLSRAEINSSYRPARRLWRRERVGHYVPSDVSVRVTGDDGNERYVPLTELMLIPLLEPAPARAAAE